MSVNPLSFMPLLEAEECPVTNDNLKPFVICINQFKGPVEIDENVLIWVYGNFLLNTIQFPTSNAFILLHM